MDKYIPTFGGEDFWLRLIFSFLAFIVIIVCVLYLFKTIQMFLSKKKNIEKEEDFKIIKFQNIEISKKITNFLSKDFHSIGQYEGKEYHKNLVCIENIIAIFSDFSIVLDSVILDYEKRKVDVDGECVDLEIIDSSITERRKITIDGINKIIDILNNQKRKTAILRKLTQQEKLIIDKNTNKSEKIKAEEEKNQLKIANEDIELNECGDAWVLSAVYRYKSGFTKGVKLYTIEKQIFEIVNLPSDLL